MAGLDRAGGTRDFRIQGPSMTYVRFGAHVSGLASASQELGLSNDSILVQLTNHHEDVSPDEFGKVPAELSWQMAVADVYQTLVHFDDALLRFCLSESVGGGGDVLTPVGPGTRLDIDPYSLQRPAGTLLGNGLPRLASGCHFVGLNIQGLISGAVPYRFLTTYLAETPAVIPLGSEYSAIKLHWRAVPYQPIWQPITATSEDPDEDFVPNTDAYDQVNSPTNNGPAWTRKFLTLPEQTINVFDKAGNRVGNLAIAERFELVREILASGTILFDRLLDT